MADASWWLAYFYPDEEHDAVLEKTDVLLAKVINNFYAPQLLTYEIGNSLGISCKRKRLNQNVGLELFEKYLKLPIKWIKIETKEVFLLSIEEKLTYYDAAYVWLALEKKVELLTLDKEMKRVFTRLKKN